MKNTFSNILSAFRHNGLEFDAYNVVDSISYKGAVHLTSDLEEYVSDYVYLGQYEDFDPALTNPGSAFLFLTDDVSSIQQGMPFEYAAFTNGADLETITEIIRSFFAYSLEQMESSEVLISTLLRGKGLNYLLDICYDILQNPVILFRPDGSIMFFSDKFGPDSHETPSLILNGRLSDDLYSYLTGSDTFGILRSSPLPIITEHAASFGSRQLIQGVYANHDLLAVLMVCETNKTFTRRDRNIVQVLGATISTEIADVNNPLSILFESRMHSLLAGNMPDSKDQREFLSSVNWNIYRNFRIIVIEMPEDQRSVIESYFRGKYHFTEACKVTVYKDQLVLFTNYPDDARFDSEMKEIEDYLKEHGIYGGVSRSFISPDEIRSQYLFARDALNAGIALSYEDHLIKYDIVDFFTLLFNASDSVDLSRYVMRELTDLTEYDSMYGTEYYATLYHYIRTNNKRETAQIMHIHKNTLSYRLQRISEIMSLDIDRGDIRTRLLLSFYSSKILEIKGQGSTFFTIAPT